MGERYVHVGKVRSRSGAILAGARTPHDVLVREVGEGGAPPGRRARLLLPPCARPAASLGEVVVRLEIGSRDRASARRRPGLSGNPEDRPSPTARRRFAPESLI